MNTTGNLRRLATAAALACVLSTPTLCRAIGVARSGYGINAELLNRPGVPPVAFNFDGATVAARPGRRRAPRRP